MSLKFSRWPAPWCCITVDGVKCVRPRDEQAKGVATRRVCAECRESKRVKPLLRHIGRHPGMLDGWEDPDHLDPEALEMLARGGIT